MGFFYETNLCEESLAAMYIFLILYLWHGQGGGTASSGGPSMTITAMPSIAVCERVGAAAKKLADAKVSWNCGSGIFQDGYGRCSSQPAEFRCITVP